MGAQSILLTPFQENNNSAALDKKKLLGAIRFLIPKCLKGNCKICKFPNTFFLCVCLFLCLFGGGGGGDGVSMEKRQQNIKDI